MIFALIFNGCSDDPVPAPAQDVPEMPPLSTMVIDFTDFADNAIDPSGGRVMMLKNWGRSMKLLNLMPVMRPGYGSTILRQQG